ncbi:MAG: capsule biosynthesis protein [Hyphomicrobiaceae bacterium]
MTVRRLLSVLALFSPTLIVATYLGLIATDRYVSEAKFVIRTAAKPIGSAGLGAVLQMAGLGHAQDEVFSVQSFITSRTAIQKLAERLPIREMYARKGADFIARYPSIIFGPTAEELYRYLGWMVTTIYSSTTGVTTLRVEAFQPEDARQVVTVLLDLGEQAVNAMNARIHKDAAHSARIKVREDQQRLIDAQVAITRFRNSELLIDPVGSSVIVTEVVARLSAEAVQTEAQIRELSAAAAGAPQLASLRRRADALQEQIKRERARIASEDGGLADKLATYERLVLDREFAKETLTASVKALEAAELEARRQQLYLERIVEPIASDYSTAPERLRIVASTFGLNLVLLMIVWLVYSGIKEHAAET